MPLAESANKIRVLISWDGSRFRDESVLQVSLRIGANRPPEVQQALRNYLEALKALIDVSDRPRWRD
jgi:hypothetical protein